MSDKVKELEVELTYSTTKELKQVRAAFETKRCEWVSQHSQVQQDLQDTLNKCKELKDGSDNLEVDNDYVQTLLLDNAPLTLKDNSVYRPETVQCVLDLLQHNVSSAQVGPVIKSVAQLCSRTVADNELPGHTVVDNMHIRGLAVSHKQLEELSSQENLTLYTDEKKSGNVYMSYAITTENKEVKVLGIQQVPSKSAKDTLNQLVDLVAQVSDTNGVTELGDQIIVNIKNTMSDRASTEKLFNELLFQYRSELVPHIVQGYESMSPNEQTSVKKINLFCGLHLMIALADSFCSTLKAQESSNEVGAAAVSELKPFIKKSEAAAVRFVRTCCKLFAPGGQDQFGVHVDFSDYVKNHGKKNMLVDFRHHRFNILFYDGAVAFYLAREINDFITKVHGPTNSLLRAVQLDSAEASCQAGARALGLLAKNLTSSLWRTLEDPTVHIADIGEYYSSILDCMRGCISDDNAMSGFITGETVPASLQDRINKDEVWACLVQPQETDSAVKTILKAVFHAWIDLLQCLVSDHLPGGMYSAMTETEQEAAGSSLKHNKICEELFGHLDRLIRLKPNAKPLTHEAHIMYRKNKVAVWLAPKDESDRNKILRESRPVARQLHNFHKQKSGYRWAQEAAFV